MLIHKIKKKAQIWGIDLIIASSLFLIGIFIFYLYSINNTIDPGWRFEELYFDGKLITDMILSEGFPKDWNKSNVVTIGILSNNKINKTKLKRFYELAKEDYNKTKSLFHTRFDYYFFLDENLTIDGNEIEGIGKPGTNKENINSENLIKISRVVIYENKLRNAYLYVWEE